MERNNFPLLQCGTLELSESATKRLQRLQTTLDISTMDALKLGLADADDADISRLTLAKLTLSDSDSDSGYDLGDAEEDCSLASASVGGSLSSRSSITGGSTESLHLTATTTPAQPLRFAVLTHDQVRRLHDVINENVLIHGRGNFPTLELRLRDLVTVVRDKLEADHVVVKDIRLNGGAASHVLASSDSSAQPYNDLDLIFAVDMSSGRTYDRIKAAVLDSLLDFLPPGVSRTRMLSCSLKEAYVSKMVKVTEGDRWSLISLGNRHGKNIELKFVHNMRRQFEFSVDSFQIILDSLLLFYDCANGMTISESFYPTVLGESMYADFGEALFHLEKKLIATRSPEEIRGGGLLKYCNLLVKDYRPAKPEEIKTLERYMCSRFFIDFPDVSQQRGKLENYLWNHFVGPDESLKYDFLMILYSVVDESTVCLMGHERRQTLSLIEEFACQILYIEQHQHAPPPPPPIYEVRISGCQPTVVYSSAGYFYAPLVSTPTSVPPPPVTSTATPLPVPTACHSCNCYWRTPCS